MIIHSRNRRFFCFQPKSLSWFYSLTFSALLNILVLKTLIIFRPTSKTVQLSDSELAQRCNSNEETRRVVLLLFCVDRNSIPIRMKKPIPSYAFQIRNKTFSCFQLRLWRAWHFLTTLATICHRLPDTTPFKNAPSADESDVINNQRRYYYRPLLQSKIQFTKRQLVPGFDPFTILCLLSLVQTNTARLLWFSSTARRKTKTHL